MFKIFEVVFKVGAYFIIIVLLHTACFTDIRFFPFLKCQVFGSCDMAVKKC